MLFISCVLQIICSLRQSRVRYLPFAYQVKIWPSRIQGPVEAAVERQDTGVVVVLFPRRLKEAKKQQPARYFSFNTTHPIEDTATIVL